MGGNYKNKKSFKRIDDITPTPADNNQAPTATPVVTGYNYPETMVGSLDNMNDLSPSMAPSTQPMSSTPLPVKRQAPTATPPATNLMRTVVPAKALPTTTGTALQMGQQAAEIKGADAWGKSRAGTFDYANETLPSANYDPVVTQAREELEKSKKFREDNDARDAVRTTDRNKVRDAKQAEAKRMRNSSEQWERDLQAQLDEKEQQRQAGPEHQARLAEIERMNAELPANPNNSSAGDERPRDAMGNLLEANNITNFADHMKFLSFHSRTLNEEDASYHDGGDDEGDEEVIINDRSTEEDNPLSPKIKANAEKAWDYRNSGYAANKIKSSWNELNALQKNQIKNLAKQKGRDWNEMSHLNLNETSNHNILLNYLNSFFK